MLAEHVHNELVNIVGRDYVLDRPDELLAYSYDATPLFQALPDVVVQPRTTTEVAAIMRLCHQHGIPVIARGSGTNLSASTTPVGGGLVLNLSRMNRIVEIDEHNLTCTVEPGVVTADIHRAVEAKGLFYPPDPGSMHVSTIGGNIAQGAGGLRGLKYGVTRDYVIGLELVLADGTVLETGGKNVKDVAGYDLIRLVVGSGGTLAVVTKAILKLVPKPASRRVAMALFDQMEDAARAVSSIIAHKIIPATLEFLDQGTIQAVEEFAHIGLPTDAGAVLIMEQDGHEAVCNADVEAMARICREQGAIDVRVAASEEEANKLLEARRVALTALARRSPTIVLEDATVPRSRIAEMVRFIQQTAEHYQLKICTFGHAGDGNLHPTCMADQRDQAEMERVHAAFAEIFAEALRLGGTITGEHGVGLAKAPYLQARVGREGMALMRRIKDAFDPRGILNPGKIFGVDHDGEKRADAQDEPGADAYGDTAADACDKTGADGYDETGSDVYDTTGSDVYDDTRSDVPHERGSA